MRTPNHVNTLASGDHGGWPNLPSGTKPIPAGNNSRGKIFARVHVAPVFAVAQTQENICEELCLKYVSAPSQICILTFAPSICMDTVAVFSHTLMPIHKSCFWGNRFRCEYMGRMYSHPGKYRIILLANCFCIGLVPGAMHSSMLCFL